MAGADRHPPDALARVLDAAAQTDFVSLVRRIERGDVRPLVAEVFPLERIVAAQELFLSKQHVGKIVLEVRGSTGA